MRREFDYCRAALAYFAAYAMGRSRTCHADIRDMNTRRYACLRGRNIVRISASTDHVFAAIFIDGRSSCAGPALPSAAYSIPRNRFFTFRCSASGGSRASVFRFSLRGGRVGSRAPQMMRPTMPRALSLPAIRLLDAHYHDFISERK